MKMTAAVTKNGCGNYQEIAATPTGNDSGSHTKLLQHPQIKTLQPSRFNHYAKEMPR